MKISREDAFVPITIVVESEVEWDTLLGLCGVGNILPFFNIGSREGYTFQCHDFIPYDSLTKPFTFHRCLNIR